MSNELVTKNEIKSIMLRDDIKGKFKDVLKDKAPAFITSVLSVVASSENLAKSEPMSVLNAAMTAATLDLPINQNLGFAYIIPYWDSKKKSYVAQFQMGYKGFIQLAQRSGQFQTINVSDVREGEIREIDRLTGEITFDWKEDRDKLPVVGYVGYMKLINGFWKSLYMTNQELKNHGIKYSQTAKKGFGLWKDEFDVMARKTVIKLLLSKYAPLTTQMQKAQLADQAIIKDENDYEYVDNDKQLPEDIAAAKEREKIIKHIKESKTVEELECCETYIVGNDVHQMFEDRKAELEVSNKNSKKNGDMIEMESPKYGEN